MKNSEEFTTVVLDIIGHALRDFSGEDNVLTPSHETVLFGEGAIVDSLTLVTIIVDIEEAALSQFGVLLALTDDEAVFREPSPYETVGNLLTYISELMTNQ